MTLNQRLALDRDPVFLMDGTAFIYRAFFASRNMQRSDGFPTNALVVLTRVLLRILREEKPRYFLFVLDGKGKNFRHALYPEYKANREAMPEDLALQIDPILEMVKALGLRIEISDGCEADDCIASLAARFSADNPVIIVSSDKDLKQCLNENVFMWNPAAKEDKVLGLKDFVAESGVSPKQWPDVQALVGDSSDHIPGVPGIGPKTAKEIFAICPSLEDIRDHFALLPPRLQAKLAPCLQEMFTWRELTRLSLTQCKELGLADLAVKPLNMAACRKLADEYELYAVKREIGLLLAAKQKLPSQALSTEMASESLDADLSGQASVKANKKAYERETLLRPDSPKPVACADKLSELPSCKACAVSVIWADGLAQPRLAIAKGDYAEPCGDILWNGSDAELCHWLGDAGKLVFADFKSLLRKAFCWQELAQKFVAGSILDLGLVSYLLNPEEGDYAWPRLFSRFSEELAESAPGLLALKMARVLSSQLAANGLEALYAQMEAPLGYVLVRMEQQGVKVDPGALQNFLGDVEAELGRLTSEIYAYAGQTFNLRSAQQIGEILFHKLELKAPHKTRGGQPSTSQETLEKLSGTPIVDSILQYRKLDKMRSTYLDPLPRLMDAENRLHTTFNQEATATGRLSSSNPNLQNIPVRGPLGKRMRRCFIAGEGKVLVAADYSQIELRILAHLSRDETLLSAFRQGEDIHAHTAALIFEKQPEDISPDQRRMAKTINFGLLYGMGARKLAQELHIAVPQARDFIERYFGRLNGVKTFYDKVIAGARELGYVTTMAGRKRWLPGILSANGQTMAQAQRQAVNTVIQGSCADIVKLAMLAVAEDSLLQALDAAFVLQIHDEFLLEVPEESAQKAGQRATSLMEAVRPGGQELSVPLAVEWGFGTNWGEAH